MTCEFPEITGAIMPLRSDKKQLRGEDIAFLQEAVNEFYVCLGMTSGLHMTDLKVRASRPAEIARKLRLLVEHYRGVTTGAQVGRRSVTPMFAELPDSHFNSVRLSFLTSSESNFYVGQKLYQKHIQQLFDDVSHVGGYVKRSSHPTLAVTSFDAIRHGYGDPTPPSTPSNVFYNRTAVIYAEGHRLHKYSYSETDTATGGTCVVGTPLKTAEYITGATILIPVNVSFSSSYPGAQKNVSCTDYIPVTPSGHYTDATDGYVYYRIQLSSLVALIPSIKSLHGITLHTYDPTSSTTWSESFSLFIVGCASALQARRGSHTRY